MVTIRHRRRPSGDGNREREKYRESQKVKAERGREQEAETRNGLRQVRSGITAIRKPSSSGSDGGAGRERENGVSCSKQSK